MPANALPTRALAILVALDQLDRPNLKQIAEHIGIGANRLGSICLHVEYLESMGLLTHTKFEHRSIRLTDAGRQLAAAQEEP